MADKTWKAFERRIAKFFGSERNPLSGGNSKQTRSDSLHDKLFIECKWTQRSALVTLYKKTKELAKLENKIPVLAITDKSTKDDLIIMKKEDLIAVCSNASDQKQTKGSGN